MQYCVTTSLAKRQYKHRLKPVIFSILFFLIIFFITAILIISKRSNNYFLSKEFYFVCVGKSENESLLENEKSKIKDIGGAGLIIKNGEWFYVTSSVYFDEDDAKSVKSRLENAGFNAEILAIKSKKIDKKYQNLFKQYQNHFDLFKFIYNLPQTLETYCYEYICGRIKEGEFISSLTKIKLEIQSKQKLCEQEPNDELNPLYNIINDIINNIDNLFNKFFISSKKESLCYECYSNVSYEFIKLCDNFQ